MDGLLTRVSGWLHAARARLQALLHGRRMDRELDEEMRFHLEQQTRKNRLAGMSEQEARRAARRAFGSVAGTLDRHRDARGVRLLDDLRQDVAHGLRRMWGRPWITLAALATLSLGIGAVTTVYSAVHALLLEPVPFPALDRLMVLGLTRSGELRGGELPGAEGWAHAADVREWQRLDPLDQVAPLAPWFVPMVGAGEPVDVIGYRTTAAFFRALGIDAIHGRTLATAADGSPEPEVVLSHRFWRTHLGADPEAVGRQVRVGGREIREMTVVGVLAPGAEYPMGTDLWGPLVLSEDAWSSHGDGAAQVRVVARLAPGASPTQARSALQATARRLAEAYPDSHGDRSAGAMPLLDTITWGTRPLLLFLMGGAACLLLLVCANVTNLQLMGATTRRQEMALRTALGAGRARLVRQLLTESLCLGLLGAAGGALLAVWGSRLIRVSMSGDWWRFFFIGVEHIDVDLPVLAFAVVVALASTVLFGLVPALRGARIDLAEAIKPGAGPEAPRKGISRRGLVVAEVSLSIVLVWGALLMVQATGSLAALDLGFDDDVAVLSIRPRSPRYEDPANLRRLIEEISTGVADLQGIAAAAMADHVPGMGIRGRATLTATPGDRAQESTEEVRSAAVTPDYFRTLGISLRGGRPFAAHDDGGGPLVAIVSESLARRLRPQGDVIGSELWLADAEAPLTIVGVAADVASAYNDPRRHPVLYRPAAQLPPGPMQLLMRADTDAESNLARDRIWQIDPEIPLPGVRTVGELVGERAAPLQMAAGLTAWFAGVALLVCLGGVHAVVSYAVSLRSHEVGVRMALGADRGSVARLFGLQGLRLCLIGAIFGVPAAYLLGSFLARGLTRFLPGPATTALAPLAALAGALLVLGAVAGWLPGRRAARADPASTLRAE